MLLRSRRPRPVRLMLLTCLAVGLSAVPAAQARPLEADLLASSPSAAAGSTGSAGIGDPYWPLDGNGQIDVRHYAIDVNYDFDSGRLSGRTTLNLTPTAELSSFNLDFLLPVTSVTVAGAPAKFSKPNAHELTIAPAKALPAGKAAVVKVEYAGFPGRYSYAGESNWLASEREVVAMNQPHMAPWWFPANDHPSDKATYDIKVTVPRGNQIIANGTLVARRNGSGTTTATWAAKEPMSSYLAFFAAGRFEVKQGEAAGYRYVNAVSRGLSGPARRTSMKVLAQSVPVTAWLAKTLGDYPFSSTGGLVTSLSPGFALENQTRPTYPSLSTTDVPLIVHELAHQWFGDNVAVHRWQDIWINEGPATFMEWVYAEQHGGTSAADKLKAAYAQTPADDDFWQLTIGAPGADQIFDWPVYARGAMTLQALRNLIGEEKFWQLIRTWVSDHGGATGSSAEFEALAEQISGRQLDDFFQAWLRTPERPAQTAANGFLVP